MTKPITTKAKKKSATQRKTMTVTSAMGDLLKVPVKLLAEALARMVMPLESMKGLTDEQKFALVDSSSFFMTLPLKAFLTQGGVGDLARVRERCMSGVLAKSVRGIMPSAVMDSLPNATKQALPEALVQALPKLGEETILSALETPLTESLKQHLSASMGNMPTRYLTRPLSVTEVEFRTDLDKSMLEVLSNNLSSHPDRAQALANIVADAVEKTMKHMRQFDGTSLPKAVEALENQVGGGENALEKVARGDKKKLEKAVMDSGEESLHALTRGLDMGAIRRASRLAQVWRVIIRCRINLKFDARLRVRMHL